MSTTAIRHVPVFGDPEDRALADLKHCSPYHSGDEVLDHIQALCGLAQTSQDDLADLHESHRDDPDYELRRDRLVALRNWHQREYERMRWVAGIDGPYPMGAEELQFILDGPGDWIDIESVNADLFRDGWFPDPPYGARLIAEIYDVDTLEIPQ